ncbi:hypothetical protein JXA32_05850 [Candidatus Sumerlaeota bacterium]|nr:hypothetical protein [Candidatus Sumerlaeota bacterium]
MQLATDWKRSTCNIVSFLVILAMTALSINANAGSCIIDGDIRYQSIDGFGCSSAWCGQFSSAKNYALYNTLGFSLLRVRIDPWGSSSNGRWDAEKNNASAAHSYGAEVLGTPWTPPPWYKDNNDYIGGSLLSSYYSNYANWLNGAASYIDLDYVSIQNEPDIDVTYESCDWTPTQLLSFCQNNAGSINIPVLMPESYQFNDSYSDPTLNNAAARNNIDIIGGHIYGSGLYTHTNALNYGKKVWMTEHFRDGANDINNCVAIAKEISDCMNASMSAYFWWWANDDDSDVNLVTNGGTINKNAYTIGQFAKWVVPGKQRISCTYQPTSGVYVTAYRNYGVVIVAVNTTDNYVWQTFSIKNLGGFTSMQVHRTAASLNMEYMGTSTFSGDTFGMYLWPKSISTAHQF